MPDKNFYTGFAIAIAWPETYCKQSDSWYDGILHLLGMSKNYYYKVGHAALVLIDNKNNIPHYFDFGRYHAPFKFGRVRSKSTDHGLAINTIPEISDNGKKIENIHDILVELQLNPECHGEGKLHASYYHINFKKAFEKANTLQKKSPIPYGPFKYKGSNCSRFVNTSILAGKPKWKFSFRMKYFVPLTPTPLNNVISQSNKIVIPKMLPNGAFSPNKIIDKSVLKSTLPPPIKHSNIPETAQWLSGEGAGSWFFIMPDKNQYIILRYNSDGVLECEGRFKQMGNAKFYINLPFKFVHLSHCAKITLQQNNTIIEFIKTSYAKENMAKYN